LSLHCQIWGITLEGGTILSIDTAKILVGEIPGGKKVFQLLNEIEFGYDGPAGGSEGGYGTYVWDMSSHLFHEITSSWQLEDI
jgi:hypothetical protein